MHEVGLAQEILKIAVDAAGQNGAVSVKKIGIRVGALSGVETSSLLFALNALKEDTAAKHAEIEIETVKALGVCGDCGAASTPDTFFSLCSHCGSSAVEIKEGAEFSVSYVDIDE